MTSRSLLLLLPVMLGVMGTPHSVRSSPVETETPAYRRAVELIRQLSSNRFSVREAATRQLLAMGRSAKEALMQARDDADPEVAERCRKLLPAVMAEDLKIRLDAFAADVEGKDMHPLPGWNRFQTITGNSKEARSLYLEMVRGNSRLFESWELEPEQFGDRFATACNEVTSRLGGRLRSTPTASDITMIFFLGSDPALAKLPQNSRYISNLLYQQSVQTAFREESGKPLRALFFAWITHRDDPQTISVALSLVQQFSLKEGFPLARRVAADRVQNAYYRAQAIVLLGKMGTVAETETLQPLLKDDALVQQFNLKNQVGTVQLRDVALAMTIHLNGRKPKEFGFEYLENEANLWSYYYLGFVDDAKRRAALEQWNREATKSLKK